MKKISLFSILVVFIALVGILGCNKNETKETKGENTTDTEITEETGQIVFKINDRPVYEDEMSVSDLTGAVNDEILYEAAIMQGVDKEPKVARTLKIYRRNFLTGIMKKKVLDEFLKDYKVPDEDVNNYYNSHKGDFTILDVNRLTIKDKSKTDEIYNKLVEGEAIDDLVNEYKKQNIEIISQKIVNTRRYNDQFNSFEIGEISKPLDEQNNSVIYVILKTEVSPLDKVASNIRYKLLNQAKAQALNDYIKKLKDEGKVKVQIIKN